MQTEEPSFGTSDSARMEDIDDVFRFLDSPEGKELCEVLSSLLSSDEELPPPPESTLQGDNVAGSGNVVSRVPITVAWMPFSGADCSRCHILRDVVHAGSHPRKKQRSTVPRNIRRTSMKLSLHGFLGGVHHAILIIQHIADHVVEHKYIADLRLLDAKSLKEFLVNHTYRCFEDGLTLVQDKYQTFYEVLSIKMDYPEDYRIPTSSMNLQASPSIPIQGGHQVKASKTSGGRIKPTPRKRRGPQIQKTGVAGQRERIKQLTYTDISQYFHLPATEAAQKLRICSTALKKVSRKFNLNRWPHRKIKGLKTWGPVLQTEVTKCQ